MADERFLCVFVNPTSGFHVHIGNGTKGNNGYSFGFIKRLVMACIECEREMDSLHSADRITGSSLPGAEVESEDGGGDPFEMADILTDEDV